MTEELLDLSDIANLYRVSRRYARDVLVKSPGFPIHISRHRDLKILMAHYYRETPDQIAARI